MRVKVEKTEEEGCGIDVVCGLFLEVANDEEREGVGAEAAGVGGAEAAVSGVFLEDEEERSRGGHVIEHLQDETVGLETAVPGALETKVESDRLRGLAERSGDELDDGHERGRDGADRRGFDPVFRAQTTGEFLGPRFLDGVAAFEVARSHGGHGDAHARETDDQIDIRGVVCEREARDAGAIGLDARSRPESSSHVAHELASRSPRALARSLPPRHLLGESPDVVGESGRSRKERFVDVNALGGAKSPTLLGGVRSSVSLLSAVVPRLRRELGARRGRSGRTSRMPARRGAGRRTDARVRRGREQVDVGKLVV